MSLSLTTPYSSHAKQIYNGWCVFIFTIALVNYLLILHTSNLVVDYFFRIFLLILRSYLRNRINEHFDQQQFL